MSSTVPPTEKVGPGLWSIPVPIPDNPLGWTSVYLLESDAGPHLVDAGWDAPASWDALCDGLDEAGTSVQDVRGVLVTHHHPDHHGLAGRVREASGAWVALHEADAALVRRHRHSLLTDDGVVRRVLLDVLAEAGTPDADVAEALASQEALQVPVPVLPDRELRDGELADVPGRRLRVLHTPGHTPGHVCLHLEDEDQLMSGDHLLAGITPHVGVYDPEDLDSDPLSDYLASLRRLGELDPIGVLPAHRARMDGARERVEELLTHHAERLEELERVLDEGVPLTPWALSARLTWNRPWEQIPALMRRVALSEVVAHVRLLERRGVAAVHRGRPSLVTRA